MKLVRKYKAWKAKKAYEKTISYFMDKSDSTIWEKDGFICIYCVVDTKNGFKTVADGFKTKADAKAYCGTNYNLFINMYWEKA